MRLTASFSLLLAAVLQASPPANAAAVGLDPCAAIAGKSFVIPSQALACLESFPYNKTIKTNVMSNAERVTDFYSFEPYYKRSPPPFQESTVQIRKEFSRIRKTKYQVSLISAVRDAVSHISVCSRITLLTVISSTPPCD
jgi:hypothetical protein